MCVLYRTYLNVVGSGSNLLGVLRAGCIQYNPGLKIKKKPKKKPVFWERRTGMGNEISMKKP
jgi:hypothetical protein